MDAHAPKDVAAELAFQAPSRILSMVDYLLLCIPGMSHLAATVMLLGRKPESKN